MKQPARLQAAKAWLDKYPGKNVLVGYKKHFAVDTLCALAELQRLGVTFDAEYVRKVQSSEQARVESRHRERERKKAAAPALSFEESDGVFAYIAGYTGWGFPYGITWEELGGLEDER
ncbi:MAG TPA: hypothetical protein VE078_13830 [Thermoanaerobaculia bacterium]|nr:hypothetical protein [Thermoanaerobaculia bacterium]